MYCHNQGVWGTVFMKYRADIDGLRAVAVLPVLFFHAGISYFDGGFIGVDVFFVISGYLIASIILNDQSLGRFTLVDFYERRMRRIAPMVFTVCIATIPFAWAWMTPLEFNQYSKSLYSSALSFSNFHFWEQADYFASSSTFQPLLHTWSLAIEFQFYILFPLIVLAFRSKVKPALVGLCIASFLLTFYVAPRDSAANFYLLPTRFWELNVGALIAFFQIRLRGKKAEAASLAGLSLIGASLFLIDGSHTYPGIWTLLPVLGTAALLASHSNTYVGKLLSLRPLVAIGLISFSVYLWHQPIFAFTRIRVDEVLSLGTYLTLIGLTLVLSYLSWQWIEKPFRQKGVYTRKMILVLTFASFTPLVVFAAIGDATNGFPTIRTSNSDIAGLGHRMRINQGLGGECDGHLPLSALCQTADEPEIIVWGDSFAMHLVAGIIESNPEVRLTQFTKSACGPILGMAPIHSSDTNAAKECIDFNNQAKAYILENNTIKYAVISSTFGHYSEKQAPILTEKGTVLANIELAQRHLEDTVAWLKSVDITPVIFLPTPRDGSEVGDCVARSIWMDKASGKCDMQRANVSDFLKPAQMLLSGISAPKIDVAYALCNETVCKPQFEDTIIFRDGAHLSFEGSAYLGSRMSFYELIKDASSVEDKNQPPA